MFVLGIDPGLSRCGYCVLDTSSRQGRAVALGVFRTDPADEVAHRLSELWGDVCSLMDEFSPSSLAIERVLFQSNVRTAMSVGQASGVIMAEAARRSMGVVEYSPNQVKDAVAGHGGADKLAVQQMVQMLLELDAVPSPPDAADAAAIALTHVAHTAGVTSRGPAGTAAGNAVGSGGRR